VEAIVIKDGMVMDGTGRPAFGADVLVEGDRIAFIGRVDNAVCAPVIEAQGLAVGPGFIDFHSHADAALLENGLAQPKVLQGVTTEVIGNCGFSLVPVTEDSLPQLAAYVAPILGPWPEGLCLENTASYFELLKKRGIAVNVASYVGHSTVRLAVMGMANRAATPRELEAMAQKVAQAMEQGCKGLSSGLLYPPGCYALTQELIYLAKVVRRYGGIYVSHIRNESEGVLEALAEALTIGQEAQVPVHISHLKACGPRNWPKIAQALEMFDRAREQGQDVTWDTYPYTAGSTTAASLLPPWVLEEGLTSLPQRLQNEHLRAAIKQAWREGMPGWDNMVSSLGFDRLVINAVSQPFNRQFAGHSIAQIAERRGISPEEALLDLLATEGGHLAMETYHASEDTLEAILAHPVTMIGSDGIYSGSLAHPRLYGTFPRVLGRYVREQKLLTWEQAVAKMTYLPAQRLNLAGRGCIREGYFADLVLFDPSHIADAATFAHPDLPPRGIKGVIVNGEVTVWEGQITGKKAGRIL